MKLTESFMMSLRALTANRMRTILTMLGIIIGVAAVIALVSAGQGAQRMVSGQIDAMGTNLIMVTPRGAIRLELDDVDYLLERVQSLSRVMPIIQASTEVSWRGNSATIAVQGVTQEFPDIRSFYPSAGRFLLKSDVDQRRKVAVIGQTVVDDIFDGEDPIGQILTVQGQSFTVVGVLEEKGESFGSDQDNVVLVPITTLQRIAGTRYVSMLYAQVSDIEETDAAVSLIQSVFDGKNRRSDTVQVSSQAQLLNTVSTITSTFTILLAAIAGISLLVGGIGIMNIMLVSVTERIREIGLRKAVGAKSKDVMFQFLVEASMLSGMGGLIGVILGSSASTVLARYGGWVAYTSPGAILLALGFSVAVGIFFGLYPAARASKLDPIYCLRYE
ncbi:MAG: ABC transporter permease [Bacillota bacterium]